MSAEDLRTAEGLRVAIKDILNPPDPEKDLLETLERIPCQMVQEGNITTFNFLNSDGQVVLTIRETCLKQQEGNDYIVEALDRNGIPFESQGTTAYDFGPGGNSNQLLFKIRGVASQAARSSEERRKA